MLKRQFVLTPAQEDTLSAIRRFLSEHGIAPTIAELKQVLNLKSSRSVVQRIEILERKGFIKRNSFKHRNIEILENINPLAPSGTLRVPVIASAGCDAMQVYAQEQFDEFLTVDRRLVGPFSNIVALKAVGNSMHDAGIRNGDYVLVEVTDHVQNGDRIAAIVGDMAVIKRYQRTGSVVFLNPENRNGGYSPIVLRDEDSRIFGKVLSVIPMTGGNDVTYDYEPGYRP